MVTTYAAAIINLQTGEVRYNVYTEWPVTRYRDAHEVHSLIAQASGSTFERAWARLQTHMDVAKLVQRGLLQLGMPSFPQVLHTPQRG